jgi:hypothetical protein
MQIYLFLCKIVFTFVEIDIYMDEDKSKLTKDHICELTYVPWLAKMNERVRLVLECIKERKDNILETDYEILRAMHGLWFTGEIPLYQTIQIPLVGKNVTQPELFNDNTSEISQDVNSFDDARDKILDGKVLDCDKTEPKIEEQK